jgi:hypothetical protein
MTSEAALAIAPAGARRIPGRALTDLQIRGEHCDSVRREGCEKLAQHIGSLKGRLVAATWQEPGMLPVARSDDAKEPAKEVTIDVAPDGLRWSSPLPRISSQQQLALVWYERDTGWNAWRTMPDVSGPVATGANSVRRPERCIAGDTNAQYRAELYLDGTLIAFGEGTLAQGPRFKPWLLSDVDMALCAPAAWAAIDVPQHSDGKAMLVRAIGADDATPAIVLFVFYGFDRAAPGPPQQIDDVKHYLVQRGWIDEKSPLERREQTAKCDKGNDNGLPAYVTWRTNEGVRQVAVALPGKLAGDACIALRSVNSRYAPDPGAAKPSRRPNVAAR